MKQLIKINLNQTISKAQLDHIKEEQQRWIIFGFMCSLIFILIIWFGITNYRLSHVISSRLQTIKEIKENTKKLQKGGKINLSKRDIKTLNNFEDDRMFWAPKLIALSKITPDDMAITGIEFENKRLRISAISDLSQGQKEFSVVEDFMAKIEENKEFNKDFKDIKFDQLEKAVVRNQEILSFKIEGKLK